MAPCANSPLGKAPSSSQPSPGTSKGVTKKAMKRAPKQPSLSRGSLQWLERIGYPMEDLLPYLPTGDTFESPGTGPEVGSAAYMGMAQVLGYTGQGPPALPPPPPNRSVVPFHQEQQQANAVPPNRPPPFSAQPPHLGLTDTRLASGAASPSPWTSHLVGIGGQNTPAPSFTPAPSSTPTPAPSSTPAPTASSSSGQTALPGTMWTPPPGWLTARLAISRQSSTLPSPPLSHPSLEEEEPQQQQQQQQQADPVLTPPPEPAPFLSDEETLAALATFREDRDEVEPLPDLEEHPASYDEQQLDHKLWTFFDDILPFWDDGGNVL